MPDDPTPSADPIALRRQIRAHYLVDEAASARRLMAMADLDSEARAAISKAAADFVRQVRRSGRPSMMESFLVEYGLSTREGIALMCLAEALLRVPDPTTIDALIQDKIAPADWGQHLGRSASSLVNVSTWALMLTGRVLAPEEQSGLVGTLRGMVRRLGEPTVRTAVGQAMRRLGSQFVLGRTIDEAVRNGADDVAEGYTYSYDMLGEAARTDADAKRYYLSYSKAISALAPSCTSKDIRANPGISVKLSALHPRYEYGHRDQVMAELLPRARALAISAKSANMGFNIDAEEADRLDLSLDLIEAMLSDPALKGWDGFGVVVQAYGPRCAPVLDWLHDLAGRAGRRIMVRLVKGAYWDSEIKRAQVIGLDGYPVFTRKVATDVSYLACARKLLGMTDRIYPQFATHNAHSVAAILAMNPDPERFEFQRLHGMGEALYRVVRDNNRAVRCRIYAPVGAHRDLLAYLVRRLLENGANSSFVHQIVDADVPPETIAADPFAALEALGDRVANPAIGHPRDQFDGARLAAKGWDLTDPVTVAAATADREAFSNQRWTAAPSIDTGRSPTALPVINPARPGDRVGTVVEASGEAVDKAIAGARAALPAWRDTPVDRRAAIVARIADLFERDAAELFALAAREAGKNWTDAVAEVREAVDFCRYYAAEARRTAGWADPPRGVFACVSPWNFPLAIFTGQIVAALVTGNCVVAKPAEQTCLIAAKAVDLMVEAGVPDGVLHCLPGQGDTVGAALTGHGDIDGVCFTGSMATAAAINRAMAANAAPDAPLIAETGGLNAMIVDSTALPEQAVRDILASAFQSAGQRCSALRVLYVQEDIADGLVDMLTGGMDALTVGDPWHLDTDVGPVIDSAARDDIAAYVAAAKADGRLIKQLDPPPDAPDGLFVPPALIRVAGIAAMEREIFGPVLHLATFKARDLEKVVGAINAKGYGLTLGVHTRVDQRVQTIVERARIGNVYVNRNQVGAVVGVQPFGGEGLSGTGPKAGGPHYLPRFTRAADPAVPADAGQAAPADLTADDLDRAAGTLSAKVKTAWARRTDRVPALRAAIADLAPDWRAVAELALDAAAGLPMAPVDLPGPTGESNRLGLYPRGTVACLGRIADGRWTPQVALIQALQALALGNPAVIAVPGAAGLARRLIDAGAPVAAVDGAASAAAIAQANALDAIALAGAGEDLRPYRQAHAARDGAIVPFETALIAPGRFVVERALCIDTTAAGGNAALMAAADQDPPARAA